MDYIKNFDISFRINNIKMYFLINTYEDIFMNTIIRDNCRNAECYCETYSREK